MRIIQKILFIVIIGGALIKGQIVSAENTPEEFLRQYIASLKHPEMTSVDSFWIESDIARSKNLGITFTGIKTKIDCASPLIYNAKYLNNDLYNQSIRVEQIDSVTARGFIDCICQDGDSITSSYYMIKGNGRWRLCSSLYLYTKDWYIIESRYYRIIFTDSSLINNYAIEALDNFTDSLTQVLEIPAKRIEYLQQHKIEYILCTQEQMIFLSGHDAHGMTSFPFDAVITRHLPHPHEVTHLVINYAFQEAPLFTLPLIQEGIACCLGGRWGKSPEIINYWGAAMENLGLVELDSLLTIAEFYTCPVGVDGSYAVGSMLTEVLLTRYGINKFKKLYFKLSGDEEYVSGLTSVMVKSIFEDIYYITWNEIVREYNSIISDKLNCGLVVDNIKPDSQPVYSGSKLKIFENGDIYLFHTALTSDLQGGIILINTRDNLNNLAYKSWQFDDLASGVEYNGARFGIICNKNEVGFYDFFTNTLLAKYVYGFTPVEGYYNEDSGSISFSLSKHLLSGNLLNYHIDIQSFPR